MRIFCPKCNVKKDILNKSRFLIYTCDECKYRFRGIHARVDVIGHICSLFFLPDFMQGGGWVCKTRCPYCWGIIPLKMNNVQDYYGPKICCYCRERLKHHPAKND